MLLRFKFVLLLAIGLPCLFISCDKDEDPYREVMIDFQNVTFPNNAKYINNAGASGSFTQDIVSFPNYYSEEWGPYWSGFAYSKEHDRTTPGKDNQYSVFVNERNDNIFAVVFVSDPNDYYTKTSLTFSQPVHDLSFDVANSTYAALAMKNGDGMASQFENDDWLNLLIQVYDEDNNPLFEDNQGAPEAKVLSLAQGTTIVDGWIHVTITGEREVSKIEFTMQSSDYNAAGMLTPAYFCLDNLAFKTLK